MPERGSAVAACITLWVSGTGGGVGSGADGGMGSWREGAGGGVGNKYVGTKGERALPPLSAGEAEAMAVLPEYLGRVP